MTRPISFGSAAPVSAIALRTSDSISASLELLGQELGQDGGLRLLGGGAVLAAGVAVDLDALAALLDLAWPRTSATSSSVRSRPSAMRWLWAAAIAERSVSVRRSSRARMASRMADSIRSVRVIVASAPAASVRASSSAVPDRSWIEAGVWRSDARGCLSLLGFLALALHAGLLVVLAASCLSQDSRLLDLLVESTQRALERLVLAHADFCQTSRLLPAS